jgi:hypothetical protein
MSILILGLLSAWAVPPVEVGTDLHAEYLEKLPISLRIKVGNPGNTDIDVPDLSKQPWLVEFNLVLPDGTRQKRKTSPGKSSATWSIKPGGQKDVWIEIPSSASLPAGSYSMELAIPALDYKLGHRFQVAEPSIGSIVPFRSLVGELSVIWIHNGEGGYDLYQYRQGQHRFLLRTDKKPPDPQWSQGNAVAALIWRDNALLQTCLIDEEVSCKKIAMPWPGAETLDSISIDEEGTLHIPIWTPNPGGRTGSLWLMSIDRKKRTNFRKLHNNGERPEYLEVAYQQSGVPIYLLLDNKGVETYQFNGTGKPSLPLVGRRILLGNPESPILHTTFSIHPEHGLSIFMVRQLSSGIVGQWFSLESKKLGPPIMLQWPPGISFEDISPLHSSAYGLGRLEDQNIFLPTKGEPLPVPEEAFLGPSGEEIVPMLFSPEKGLHPLPK